MAGPNSAQVLLKMQPKRSFRSVGLFAGIGGLELGLGRSGHASLAMCEIDLAARAVLKSRFPGVAVSKDIARLRKLPRDTDLVVGGFPCQDLSQAGRTLGLRGAQSSLVDEVLRLLRSQDIPWVLLENVPFMLQLAKGAALASIVKSLEEIGYRWAYRVINSQAFGLPQRRERVFILASKEGDPRDVLLAKDTGIPAPPETHEGIACGFYWTEGSSGLGWAVDAIPTLKNGSTIGIASPPAIWLPDGEFVKPGIRDAERMQGFPAGWTRPSEDVAKPSIRWKLVGNAVTVDVAEWIGKQLASPGTYKDLGFDMPIDVNRSWPRAAYNVGQGRYSSSASSYPVRRRPKPLAAFLTMRETSPLSLRAVSGFLSRFEASTLKKPDGFLEALRAYRQRAELQG